MTSVLSQESSILHPIDVPPSRASMSKTWTMMRLLETLLADEVDEVDRNEKVRGRQKLRVHRERLANACAL